VKREELGEHVYEKILEASQLYYYLREDWKVTPDHGTVLIDVAVVGTVQASEFMRPESSTIRIAVKLIR
jgi:hypothetical protein